MSFNHGISRTIAGLGRRGDSRHHHFLVYAPDMTDGEATQRRFAVRPQHLEKVAPLIQSRVLSEFEGSHSVRVVDWCI